MALVKCPECGTEISSQTRECVHCGCKIKICPECGAALLDGAQVCSECGYEIEAKESERPILKAAPAKTEKDENTVKLEKRIVFDAKVDKGMNIAKRVIEALASVLFIVCIGALPILKNAISLSGAMLVAKIALSLDLVILIPFVVADIIYDIYSKIGLKAWLVRVKIDVETYIKKYGSVSVVNDAANVYNADSLKCLKTAAFLIRKPSEMASIVISNVLKFLRMLLLIPFIIWFFAFFDELVYTLSNDMSLTVGMFLNATTITVIVLFVALSVAKFVVEILQDKRVETYIVGLKTSTPKGD